MTRALGKVILDKDEAFVGNIPKGKPYYFCHNHDVATHKYDCPYADIIDNTICCTAICAYNKNPERMTIFFDEDGIPVASNSVFDDNFDYPF